MNAKERSLVRHLQKMRERHGIVGVKAEFEAEGSTFDEVLCLKHIAVTSGLGVALKIGGAEDVWGLKQALKLDVRDVVAPMVESPYALQKYLEALKKFVQDDEREDITAAVNIETYQAYSQIDAIIAVGKAGGLECVTVGRVDFVGSMGLPRAEIDSDKVYELTAEICRKAKAAGFRSTMGGGIELGSRNFITKLVNEGILDRFETRKVIFPVTSLPQYTKAILDAHLFELGWLENRAARCNSIIEGDRGRIAMLQKRIEVLRKED